jgi:hypothetical protein
LHDRARKLLGRHQPLQRQGTDLMKLFFGQKISGQTCSQYKWIKCKPPDTVDQYSSDNDGINDCITRTQQL